MNKIRLEYALVIARFQYGQYCPCFSYFADLYVINEMQNMRNQENVSHIVRDKHAINILSLTQKISAFC